MSWSRSSKLGLVALLLIALVVAVGVASAVSVTSESVPEESEVGQDATVQFELQSLYAQESRWSFDGRTSLENATWTITEYQGDSEVDSHTFQASSPPNGEVQLDQSADDAPDRLVVEITGTVPPVESYSYQDPATFRAAEFAQVTGDGASVVQEWQVHHYTTGDPGSQEAQAALDQANATIQSAADNGTEVSDAESTFQDAVSAYDGGNFANAVSLAEEAESQATSSGSDDGSSDDGSSDGGTTDGTSGGSDGDGTSDGSDDGSGSDGTGDSSDGSDAGSDNDGATTADADSDADDSNGGDSDDGGLLWVLLYALLGLLILGAVGGGILWYRQQQQGPNRDPLG